MTNISTLQQSLVNAKKVMERVEGGGTTHQNSSRKINMPSSTDGLVTESMSTVDMNQQIPTPNPANVNIHPKANLTEDKIKNSKLPNAIKEAMINTPIPDIPFNGGGAALSEQFLSGVKDEMKKQGVDVSPPNSVLQHTIPTNNTKSKKITSKDLKSIIKESVKEILHETLGIKTDNDENFQFRVGDRLFYGKITSSKKIS